MDVVVEGSPTRRWPKASTWWKIGRELVYVGLFEYLYELIRGSVVQSGALATRHALWVVDVEHALGLFQERGLQSVFLHSHGLVQAFNLYYGGTHFLVPAATLIWLAARNPPAYLRARTLLAVTTAVGFVCFWLFPVAPPRLLPARYEIVDTIRHLGGQHVEAALMDRAGNAYAAFPSLHMAWAVWCTLALYPLLRHRWTRVVAVAYPVLTGLVVVATGNHFVLDCIAGTGLILAVAWALERLRSVRATQGVVDVLPAEALAPGSTVVAPAEATG